LRLSFVEARPTHAAPFGAVTIIPKSIWRGLEPVAPLAPMDWREMCLNRARSCEERAEQTSDPNLSAVYRALAEQWRALAEEPGPPTVEKPRDETR
jgi:hypothetical protein